MRQIFIVYLWSAKIFNKSIIEICTQKMHRVSTQSTQKMHKDAHREYTKDAHRELLHKGRGVASCAAAQLQ